MGARADHHFNLLKRAFPAALITSAVASAFFRGLASVAEALELVVDQNQAQTFVDTAVDIWLTELARQRGVSTTTGISDADLRSAIHQYDDRTTPNGMLEMVNELVDLYAIITGTSPDVDQGDALLFEPIRDGAYAHSTNAQIFGAFRSRGSAFANHIDCIAGPLGSASFEVILPGITIAGGSYADATGSVDKGSVVPEGAAFAHDTGAGPVDAFATNPRMAAWVVINQITKAIQQFRAAGVPAWAQTRPSEKGLLANAYFTSLTTWVLSGGGSFSLIFDDPDTKALEATRCLELDQSGGGDRRITSIDAFTMDADSVMRVQVSAKKVAEGAGGLSVGVQDGTSGDWWNPTTLSFQVAEVLKSIEGLLLKGVRTTIDVFTNIEMPKGGNPKVRLFAEASDIYRVFHVGLHKEF